MAERALLALVGVVLLAGCVGVVPSDGGTASTTSTTPPTSGTPPTGTTADVPPPTDCGDVWVAFYAVGTDVQDRLWDPDAVSIGYTVPGGERVFFVAYEGGDHRNGTVIGVERVEYGSGYPVTADGAPVELDRPLSGEHAVSVVAHADSNGDGEFDRTRDRACLSDGKLVTTGVRTFDFSAFGGETTEG